MFICCICTWTNSLWVFAAALLLRNATKGFTGRTHHQRWLHHKREASSSSGWWLLWLVDTLTGFVVLILTYAFPRANTTIKQKREDTKTYEVTVCHGDILTCQKAYSHMMLNHPYRYQQNLVRELSQNLAISVSQRRPFPWESDHPASCPATASGSRGLRANAPRS